MQKLKGTAMEELVIGGKLKRADILLTRSKRSLLGWLIRLGTGSDWDHALMVYTIRATHLGYERTFIIESKGAGIDIHNIAHYFDRPKKYDVGIKRLEAPWFADDSDTGGLRYRRRIRGFSLQEIDDKYDYRLILGITRRILRQIILAFLFPRQRFKPPEERRVQVQRVLGFEVNAYICSGFVQWAYCAAVSRIVAEDGLDPARIREVVFNPRISGEVTESELLSTTPADIANSDKLSWIYVIKDGVVHEVASEEEVNQILYPEAKKK
jgi:hypothetical protein